MFNNSILSFIQILFIEQIFTEHVLRIMQRFKNQRAVFGLDQQFLTGAVPSMMNFGTLGVFLVVAVIGVNQWLMVEVWEVRWPGYSQNSPAHRKVISWSLSFLIAQTVKQVVTLLIIIQPKSNSNIYNYLNLEPKLKYLYTHTHTQIFLHSFNENKTFSRVVLIEGRECFVSFSTCQVHYFGKWHHQW